MWWLALLIACSDDDRLDALEARIVELEAKQTTLETELAEARASSKPELPPPSSPVDPSHWPVREVEPGRYIVDRARMNELLPAEEWSGQARLVPHRGPEGGIDGYRISGIRRSSAVAALGLKNGDVVHALNDIPLTSMENTMLAYEAAQRDERLEASISRRGEPMTLIWEPGTVPVEPGDATE